jgi:hypothetical protein
MSVKLLSSQERYIQRGRCPGNQTLNRRTQKNARKYVCRLGYNTICNSYTDDFDIMRLSGSSLNRAQAKKRKDELQKLSEAKAQIHAPFSGSVDDYAEYRAQVTANRANPIVKCGTKNWLSKSSNKLQPTIHVFSARSKGKVRDKATALYRCFKETGIFATLTFIQDVGDRQAVKILNKFLTVLRQGKKEIKYLWVAERQESGRIHFHVVLSKRLSVAKYNALWVRQQYHEGLRHRNILPGHIDAMTDKEIQKKLNPFDIEKITTVWGLCYYMTKYITKNKGSGFDCLAWHCSRSVSKLFTKTVVTQSTFKAALSFRNTRVDKKTGELVRSEKHGRFYSLYYIEDKCLFLPDMAELEQINCWILEGMLPDKVPEINDFDIGKFYNN